MTENGPINTRNEADIPEITFGEVKDAIRRMKKGKAHGVDMVSAELIKAGGPKMVNSITNMFNSIIKTGKVPDKMKVAEIVVIHKKGDTQDPKNFRPISLLSHFYKCYIMVITKRIQNNLLGSIDESQAAYQEGRATTEHIISLKSIIEKSCEYNRPCFMLFIDFIKAYDVVSHEALWKALETTDINKRYINIIKSCYKNAQATIRTDQGKTRLINLGRGVKQGCVASCYLFLVLLSVVMRNTKARLGEETGYEIGEKVVGDLGWADDLVFIQESEEKLQNFTKIYAEEAEKVGLKMNISKTKCMSTKGIPIKIQINNAIVEQVSKYKYLGYTITESGNDESAINERIGLGWAAFNNKKAIIKSRKCTMKVKKDIIETYIYPVVTYGLECATWTKALEEKLNVFQNKLMRISLDKTVMQKMPIQNLKEKTGFKDIFQIIKSSKINLFNKCSNHPGSTLKACVEGAVEGKRSRGRPKKRWLDDIKAWLRTEI